MVTKYRQILFILLNEGGEEEWTVGEGERERDEKKK